MAVTTAPAPLNGLRIGQVIHFDPNYARTRVTAKMLRRAGATVIPLHHSARFAQRAPGVWADARRLQLDAFLVGYLGHADMPIVRAATARRGTPVIFDPLLSLYETNVEDRGTTPRRSLTALRYRLEDAAACHLARLVMLDTDAHIEYFSERLRLDQKRFRRVWVGADDDAMRPSSRDAGAEPFRVVFYGAFTPLHNVEDILRAAKLLERAGERVEFEIIGEGQSSRSVQHLAKQLDLASVRFLGRVPYAELPGLIGQASLCLGIFGASPRASRVIPNKVFDYLACARPVVTADTRAAREALVHADTAWLCPPGNPEALAESIAYLKCRPALRRTMAEAGHALYRREFSLDAMTPTIARVVLDALQPRS